MNKDKAKICPKCYTAFTCSPIDCWCSKLPPVMPMVTEGGCYCPACLGEIIDNKLAQKAANIPYKRNSSIK